VSPERARLPIYDANAPIACSLDDVQLADRLALMGRLRGRLAGIERTEHGMLLRFPPDPDLAGELDEFARVEKACCGFWGFEVTRDRAETSLRWDAPPAADGLVERLYAWLEGDDDVDPAGLL
jgi:hypothetical protein